MNSRFFGPRKRRTRQHVIADQSVHYVEGFILAEGHTAQKVFPDYGYDLIVYTYDEVGYREPGFLLLQIKASESLQMIGSEYFFDLEVRDYNLWIWEREPVILILFDASRRNAHWLHVQDHFRGDGNRKPKKGARTIRVRVPITQIVNRRAIAKMRKLKSRSQLRIVGEEP